jgi:tRNA modification GTPase
MSTQSTNDTIAAIATAPGEAGISIVRISGPASLGIADQVFRGSGEPPSRQAAGTFRHGFIRRAEEGSAASSADLDEVILLVYRAPHSYTREDVVEIQGHGGRACARRILQTVLACGARLAEPGEFTRRAFLSGRIDLLQAEAVMDLVDAQFERAASSAIEKPP